MISLDQISYSYSTITIFKNKFDPNSRLSVVGWLQVCSLTDFLSYAIRPLTFRYPHFTMLFQMLAMIVVGYISLHYCFPHIYIDTTGVPFSYPLAKFFGCKVITYIHYPILSSVCYTKSPSPSLLLFPPSWSLRICSTK
jgi:hypothetical protein